MGTFPDPLVHLEDYDTIRRIVNNDMPDAYDEWLDLQSNKRTETLGGGHAVRQIEINPEAFARYCATAQGKRGVKWLFDFAFEEMLRQEQK